MKIGIQNSANCATILCTKSQSQYSILLRPTTANFENSPFVNWQIVFVRAAWASSTIEFVDASVFKRRDSLYSSLYTHNRLYLVNQLQSLNSLGLYA